ncbi:hypothetical protein [Zooshikella sp. RANM57]|uniref:hypothetical protein n=1 Tax=Zooshikella sp. RANM57 TaxID=3425863 RepID=UPI003D6FF187
MSKESNWLQKIKKIWQAQGLFGLICRIYHKYFWQTTELVWLRLDLTQPLPPTTGRNRWQVKFLTEADLPNCKRYFEQHIPVYQKLLKKGLLGTIGQVEEDVVAIFWVSPQSYFDHDQYHCEFIVEEQAFYQFAGEVAQPLRGSGIALDIQLYAWHNMQLQGYHYSICTIDSVNVPSLKLHFHVGFDECGKMTKVHCYLGCIYQVKHVHYKEPKFKALADRYRRKRLIKPQ